MVRTDCNSERYQVGDLVIDARSRSVTRAGKVIRLPKLSFNLLLELVRAGPDLVTNESLLSTVWKGKIVGPETVTQRVKLVRDALGDDSNHPRYIDVVWGEGYRLCVTVESISEDLQIAASEVLPRPFSSQFFRPPVVVALTLLSVAAVLLLLSNRLTTNPTEAPNGRTSLAVVATLNLTGDVAINEFGVALRVRMTSELGRLGSVDVTIPATAEYLLRSAMIRSGDDDAVRFTVGLIDKEDGKTIWSGFFDWSTQDADQFAEHSVSQVVRNIQLSLLPAEEQRLAATQPGTEEVERLHRDGRDALENGDLAGAFDKLGAVIELDPDRAQAHSDLARALIKIGWYTQVSSAEVIPQAEAAARSALQIDPSLAEPYLVLANAAAFYHWDWERAEVLYQEALARNPGHAPTYLDYAGYLFVVGRIDEGLQQIDQAETVDPFSANTHGQIGVLYHYIRKWDAAHRHYDAAIGLQPDNLFWQINKGCTYIFQGDFYRGSALISGLRELAPDNPMSMVIDAYLAAVTGDDGRARSLLDRLDSQQLAPLSELMRSSIYVALQRDSDAVQLLQLAKEKRLLALPFSAIHPTHDPLRSRTEYTNLLLGLGLEPEIAWYLTDADASL